MQCDKDKYSIECNVVQSIILVPQNSEAYRRFTEKKIDDFEFTRL